MDGGNGAGNPELEVRLLGPIEVERGSRLVALGGQKPRALFAVLALEPGRVVSVDRLVAALEDGDAASSEVAPREALALCRGPALADFIYEPFAQNEIARLEELRTVVVEERIEADLALGRHAELVPELEALVQAEPLR